VGGQKGGRCIRRIAYKRTIKVHARSANLGGVIHVRKGLISARTASLQPIRANTASGR